MAKCMKKLFVLYDLAHILYNGKKTYFMHVGIQMRGCYLTEFLRSAYYI